MWRDEDDELFLLIKEMAEFCSWWMPLIQSHRAHGLGALGSAAVLATAALIYHYNKGKPSIHRAQDRLLRCPRSPRMRLYYPGQVDDMPPLSGLLLFAMNYGAKSQGNLITLFGSTGR